MATNLIEAIQTRLGYAPLHKIDPNTQEVKAAEGAVVNHLAQAVIPSVLVGIYKLSTAKENVASLLHSQHTGSWVSRLFGDNADTVVKKVADYGKVSEEEAAAAMENTAHHAVESVKEVLPQNADSDTAKSYFNAQLKDIKTYLPGALQLGVELKDNTLDDRTHKMEGPMSGAMHAIERLFSDSENQKKEE